VHTLSGVPNHPDVAPVRTGRKHFHQCSSELDRQLERRRRAILCAYGTCTGLLNPPYSPSSKFLERTIRRIPDGGGGMRLQRLLHGTSPRALLATPTGHNPELRIALSNAKLSSLPRCQTFAELRRHLHTAPGLISSEKQQSSSEVLRLPAMPGTAHGRMSSTTSPIPEHETHRDSEDPNATENEFMETAAPPDGLVEGAATHDDIIRVNVSDISNPNLKNPIQYAFLMSWNTGDHKSAAAQLRLGM
jgi:hypothetical protein